MIVLGLTGSIGMGKTTVTGQFAEAGAATTHADAIVHRLLAEDAEVIADVGAAFPHAMVEGRIDRRRLGDAVFGDDAAIRRLEQILHPRVRVAELAFVLDAQAQGYPLVVLDIPLLYETGAESRCDAVVVVTAPEDVQRQRVLARAEMTEEKFRAILARQLPDSEKRARADYVVETQHGLAHSAQQVGQILAALGIQRKDSPHA